MYCNKKYKRNIFSLFNEFECSSCMNFLNDEIIKIGNKKINIFYLINECKYNKREILKNSKKINLIFKDIYIDSLLNSNNIFLWLNKNDTFNNYYDDLNIFLNNDFNIYIII